MISILRILKQLRSQMQMMALFEFIGTGTYKDTPRQCAISTP
jgi:hypothetical protein